MRPSGLYSDLQGICIFYNQGHGFMNHEAALGAKRNLSIRAFQQYLLLYLIVWQQKQIHGLQWASLSLVLGLRQQKQKQMLLRSVSFKWAHQSPPCHVLGARLISDDPVLPDTKSFMECISIVKLEDIFLCIKGLICHIVYSSISSMLTYLFASI